MHRPQQRIYSALIPDEASRQLLASYAEQLKPRVKGRFVDPETYHATLMHFGIPSQVFAELQIANPKLNQTQFESAFNTYIEVSGASLPTNISLRPENYTLLGGRKNVLALSLESTPEFQQIHIQSLQHLRSFFDQVDIEDADRFMRTSQNFSWALGIKPHVTLARGVIGRHSAVELPHFNRILHFPSSRLHGTNG